MMHIIFIIFLTSVFKYIDTDHSQTAPPPCDKKDGDEQEKSDAVIFEDDFSLWCMKISVFFKRKFFPAAEKYELLNKIAQENM
jgi:hypothetical protein